MRTSKRNQSKSAKTSSIRAQDCLNVVSQNHKAQIEDTLKQIEMIKADLAETLTRKNVSLHDRVSWQADHYEDLGFYFGELEKLLRPKKSDDDATDADDDIAA